MRLPNRAHTDQPWRIHQLLDDFVLEDVWSLPGLRGTTDFHRLVALIADLDPCRDPASPLVRGLFAVRMVVGAALGWDAPRKDAPSLRDRLPEDLRAAPGPEFAAAPFRSLYLLDDEWAAETVNRTVHGVLHLGLVADADGGYHAQLAVLVKPNGLLGTGYLAAIKPFRYLVVYPSLTRDLSAQLAARQADAVGTP